MTDPYKDKKKNATEFVRTFESDVHEDELIWHRDKYDRRIRVVDGDEWQLQMDNELPKAMIRNEVYFIEANTYHRIIKGKNALVLEIEEQRS